MFMFQPSALKCRAVAIPMMKLPIRRILATVMAMSFLLTLFPYKWLMPKFMIGPSLLFCLFETLVSGSLPFK